jgi:hypothetical protein
MKIFPQNVQQRHIIAIVNGYPRSGKDTFVDFAGERFTQFGWAAFSASSIDMVKEITAGLGVEEEPKTPEKRALWAEVKQALEKYDHLTSRAVISQIGHAMFQSAAPRRIGFIHVREPEAIEFMRSIAADFEFMTVFVDRPAAERITSNTSDMKVEKFEYDHRIYNDKDLPALQAQAFRFVEAVISGRIR